MIYELQRKTNHEDVQIHPPRTIRTIRDIVSM